MTKENFERDYNYSKSKLPTIKRIIKNKISLGDIISVREGNEKEDLEMVTDLVIYLESGDIAVRIMRPGAWKEYKNILFRKSRPTGAKTEVEKLKDGFADYYFYMWDSDTKEYEHYMFFDLNKLREENFFSRLENRSEILCPDRTTVSPVEPAEIRNLGAVISEGDGKELTKTVQTKLKGIS